MQRAEDRQGNGETQIAQGYNLVEAALSREIVFRSPKRDQKKQEAGEAHRDCGPGELKKCGGNDGVHVDANLAQRFELYDEAPSVIRELDPTLKKGEVGKAGFCF
jgi:hypothetical protein